MEGSESDIIDGQGKRKDQMHWKVVNQTVKIVKKKRSERGYLSDMRISTFTQLTTIEMLYNYANIMNHYQFVCVSPIVISFTCLVFRLY